MSHYAILVQKCTIKMAETTSLCWYKHKQLISSLVELLCPADPMDA